MKKTIFLFKLLSALVATLLTQGCVGVVTRGMETQTFAPVMIARKPATYSVEASGRMSGNDPEIENPTSLWVRQHWGQPSHVKQVTRPIKGELWTYNFDHKWCGVMPCLVIPIPLLLPVGTERVVFQIQNGRVTTADVTTLCGYQAVAGWGPEGPMATSGRWK